MQVPKPSLYSKLKIKFLDWLSSKLQPLVERKFSMKETYELEQVQHQKVKLPYVLIYNKSIVSNKFRILIRLEKIRLEVFNKDLKVGRILYDGTTRIAPRSSRSIQLEVRLSHITAFFQMLRFFIVSSITIDVRGEVQLKLLGMTFFVPVRDQLEIPRDKFRMMTQNLRQNLDKPTSIPFEEVVEEPIPEDSIANPLENTIQENASDLLSDVEPNPTDLDVQPTSPHDPEQSSETTH